MATSGLHWPARNPYRLKSAQSSFANFMGVPYWRMRNSASVLYQCWSLLTSMSFVVHVHGNNCGDIVNLGNIVIPETIEVTSASSRHHQPLDLPEIFPADLDMPSQEGQADIFLRDFWFN